jgi:hypothetical protein
MHKSPQLVKSVDYIFWKKQNTEQLVIYYLRLTIEYLISSLRPLCPQWLNNERRVMEIFPKSARQFARWFV